MKNEGQNYFKWSEKKTISRDMFFQKFSYEKFSKDGTYNGRKLHLPFVVFGYVTLSLMVYK